MKNAADVVSTDRIKDLTATLLVIDAEVKFDELKKIGGAFATTYRFKRMDISYKSPNKARFEAKILGASALIVFNGDTKMFRVPFKKEVQNVAGKPGQKQSLLDLGLFAKDWLATDWRAVFVRKDGPLLVFKLEQRGSTNQSHEIVWVNPQTSITERRQTFNGDNKRQKELRYKNAKSFGPGVWVPTRVEVYNQFGTLAAAQRLENITVNAGVPDSRFATS